MNKHSKLNLTKKEQEIMSVLWNSDHPLSVSEICNDAEKAGLSLNHSTVQMTVNKLLKKGLIRVGEITQHHKALARAFQPEITSDEYTVLKLRQIMNDAGKDKKSGFIAALLDDKDLTEQDLAELADMIEDMKDE